MSARDDGYCHGSLLAQEVFRFDVIMDVCVAAVRPTQTSWRSRRPVRHERFNSARAYELRTFDREGVPLALTQTQLAAAGADRAEITRAEAKRLLGALEEIVLEELGNAHKVRVVGLVQLTVRV